MTATGDDWCAACSGSTCTQCWPRYGGATANKSPITLAGGKVGWAATGQRLCCAAAVDPHGALGHTAGGEAHPSAHRAPTSPACTPAPLPQCTTACAPTNAACSGNRCLQQGTCAPAAAGAANAGSAVGAGSAPSGQWMVL